MTQDAQLMIRIQDGDASAFDELVGRHQAPLVGFFLRNTRDIQLSEDLTQETLLRIYSRTWDYLPRGRFRSWMYRVARNLLIDNVRRHAHDALVKAVRGRPNDDETDVLAGIAGDLMSPASPEI